MKFSGELKFPEIDHPGVPVQFVIEGAQAELVVEGESLGKWSLYDVHARRLVASAFQIDLDGTEVTFVAADPIDFAYRGVEHMAESWADMKSRRLGRRGIAVRKSRKGIEPSRLDDLRAAMEANLEDIAPKPLAGEVSMPAGQDVPVELPAPQDGDWDMRDQAGSIPVVGTPVEAEQVPATSPEADPDYLAEQKAWLEEEKSRIADERARLEAERQEAERREANLLEAYRLEMERLEVERTEVRRQAEEAAQRASIAAEEVARATAEKEAERAAAERAEAERAAAEEAARVAAERASAERAAAEQAAKEAEERAAAALAAAEQAAREAEVRAEREAAERAEAERAAAEEAARVAAAEQAARESEQRAAAERKVLDLKDLEDGTGDAGVRVGEPEPALAGAVPKEKSGLMGAVKAAFRGGARDHAHQFVEAPGGIGITRYVCEECGYVSISVGG